MNQVMSPTIGLTPVEIVKSVCFSYTQKKGIFAVIDNAEDIVPPIKPELQVQYLFWVIQMDYATKSSLLYERATSLYHENNDWIHCNYLLTLSSEELLAMVKEKLKPRYPNEIAQRFKINAQHLQQEYQGKAITLVSMSSSAQELLTRIQSFRGFGNKIGNFLLRTYVNLLKLSYDDIDSILPPVDVHDVRLTYEWGFITSSEMSHNNIIQVKNIWSQACKQAGLSWLIFDKALWLIGSKGQRTKNYQEDFYKNLGL